MPTHFLAIDFDNALIGSCLAIAPSADEAAFAPRSDGGGEEAREEGGGVGRDHQAARGDDRATSSWYNAALSSAAQIPNLPQDLIVRLDRAQASVAAATARFEAHLNDALTNSGIDPAKVTPRFGEAIDIIAGRREVFVQQPTSFFYPGLANIQFFENDDFAWVAVHRPCHGPAWRRLSLAVMAAPRR